MLVRIKIPYLNGRRSGVIMVAFGSDLGQAGRVWAGQRTEAAVSLATGNDMGKSVTIVMLQHGADTGVYIPPALRLANPQATIVVVPAHQNLDLPAHVDGIVLGGSPLSLVDAGHPELGFIRPEAELLRRLMDQGMPILGICFGHQLLAHIFGGQVSRAATPEYGSTEVHWHTDGQIHRIFQCHEDEVSVEPEGTTVVASSPDCRVQALRFDGLPVFSVQSHPEIDRSVIHRRIAELESHGLTVNQVTTVDDDFCHGIYRSFFDQVEAVRSA